MKLRLTIPDSEELEKIIKEGVKGDVRLKDSIYYIVSKLTISGHNAHKFNIEQWTPLSSKTLEGIIGKDRYRKLLKICLNVIFERNESYQVGKKSKEFRLKSEFQTGKFRVVKTDTWFEARFKSSNAQNIEEVNILENQYEYLRHQFSEHSLSLGNAESALVKDVSKKIVALNESGKPFNEEQVFNRLGIWQSYINTMEKNNSQFRPSASNHRLHTILTSLPKYLRSFLTINNKPVVEIDLRCSQPYVLACILSTQDFFTSDHGPFTCASIYPKIYESLQANGLPNFISDFWLTNNAKGELGRFRYALTGDFYQYLIDVGNSNATWLFQDHPDLRQRSFVKEEFMRTLFDDNFHSRLANPVTKLFTILFPNINNFIVNFMNAFSKASHGKSPIARLLQRVEAYLVLRVATQTIRVCNINIPIFTIHDSILTTEDYKGPVEYFVQTSIQNVTKIRPLLVCRPVASMRGNVDSLFKDTSDQRDNSDKKDQMRFIFSAMAERGREMIQEQSHREAKKSA
jgi:hypothetical protein